MRRVILVHRWNGTPEADWYPWFKRELEGEGIRVEVPAMVPADAPNRERWVAQLSEFVGVPDEETYLVGHSVGCITILRYLEGLPEGQRVGGVVLIAGFTDNLGYEELTNYFTTPINWSKIQSHVERFIAIHSDNDQYVPLRHGDVFRDQLGAALTVLHDRKHFEAEDGTTTFPEARDAVLKLAGLV